MSKPRGYVIYRGPSLLDGAPIVAVALVKSRNAKTDNMVQTYIIRADLDPRDANRTGADFSICGTCPHRGVVNPDKVTGLADARSCYVVMGQGPLQVYKSLQAGKYPDALAPQADCSAWRWPDGPPWARMVTPPRCRNMSGKASYQRQRAIPHIQPSRR